MDHRSLVNRKLAPSSGLQYCECWFLSYRSEQPRCWRVRKAYVAIDDPSAGTGPAEGTFPTAIANGWVTGTLRWRRGSLPSPRLPACAQRRVYQDRSARLVYHSPYGMNLKTQVVGIYADSSRNEHGFLRNSDGIFITLDAPGASLYVSMGDQRQWPSHRLLFRCYRRSRFLWDTVNVSQGLTGGKTSTGIFPVAITVGRIRATTFTIRTIRVGFVARVRGNSNLRRSGGQA